MTHHSQALSNQPNGKDCSTQNPHVRPATTVDAYFISKYLREADRKELYLSHGEHPYQIILQGMEDSMAWVGISNGLPTIIFGCNPHPDIPGWGIPWLVGTDDLKKVSIEFLRSSAKAVNYWQSYFKVLANYVHEDNVISKRWLKSLGFVLFPAELYGVNGGNFHLFMRKS